MCSDNVLDIFCSFHSVFGSERRLQTKHFVLDFLRIVNPCKLQSIRWLPHPCNNGDGTRYTIQIPESISESCKGTQEALYLAHLRFVTSRVPLLRTCLCSGPPWPRRRPGRSRRPPRSWWTRTSFGRMAIGRCDWQGAKLLVTNFPKNTLWPKLDSHLKRARQV